MGEDAVNQTIPLILCGEEDVQGSHGATIGRLDDELLFYLCSRGMSRQAANKIDHPGQAGCCLPQDGGRAGHTNGTGLLRGGNRK